MSGATCPACGVSVMPGYARCPKCRRPLPRRAVTNVSGGTAVDEKSRWPMFAALGAAVVGAGLIMFLASGDDDTKKPAAAPVDTEPTQTAQPTNTATNPTVTTSDTPSTTTATAPDPVEVAAELERALKRQRLWSTVSVVGGRVDVRSGSCADPAMGPMLEGSLQAFKAAGLTKLRCVEQSGRVVTDRDL